MHIERAPDAGISLLVALHKRRASLHPCITALYAAKGCGFGWDKGWIRQRDEDGRRDRRATAPRSAGI